MTLTDLSVPPGTPDDVRAQAARGEPREPCSDPTLGVPVPRTGRRGVPPHRLVVLGDSLSHGFQSGAVYNTDLSWPAIVAHELGWLDRFRYPVYGGPGGLPLNLELLLRRLEERFGRRLSLWETPLALFEARGFLDEVEDHWERGPGHVPPRTGRALHNLSVYGWDLRDTLSRTAGDLERATGRADDSFLDQAVQDATERAALRVYPRWDDEARQQTLVDAATGLGRDHGEAEAGIETLVVFLGANNALPAVTDLRVRWSDAGFQDLRRKGACTVWRPEHFAVELAELVAAVRRIDARHVIWCTVPHVTIAPIARGIGAKVRAGSRYYAHYARPWVDDARFDPARDAHLTEHDARAVDAAIDLYNTGIEAAVRDARRGTGGTPRDWYLLDVAGLLDRLASRRYVTDPAARPSWWTPYPLPPALAALQPALDSRFLVGDGRGGRAAGGLFSLDGVHPTTVGYGLLAQEVITVMAAAGVVFTDRTGRPRGLPVQVDFDRLLRRDSLVRRPPQLLDSALDLLGWADENLRWVSRTLSWRV
ncbi:hypothetical protein [Modestobacter versicolor]|uniref:hypothetical protein n=1 Tax=Modestobacter versicolor TaxID=429133 RepID=UPI0034E00403